MKRYERQKGAPWLQSNNTYDITIIGAGTIGSWTTLSLVKAVDKIARISVVDYDVIEGHNSTGQLYPEAFVGLYKIYALNEIIQFLAEGSSLTLNHSEVNEELIETSWGELFDEKIPHFIIIAVDNMEVRNLLWKFICDSQKKGFSVIGIDTRLSPEVCEILTSRTHKESQYILDNYIYDKKELSELPCSYKSTTYTGMYAASMITSQVTNIISNINLKASLYPAPFRILMNFNTNKQEYEHFSEKENAASVVAG